MPPPSHPINPRQRLPPSSPSPYVKDASQQGVALYHDVGYGLRPSQRARTFRMPMTYSNELADFNHWDAMFMERLVGDITLHKPTVAPGVVLTLGNGFDLWAVRAVQKWPKCRVTVHSLSVHKHGMDAIIRSMSLADRITYVRGDPSRELHLDYPNNTFDLVRLSYCSLNFAETEWYVFLQEVNRILKPGGVLEIIDEDLPFPGRNSPEPELDTNVAPCSPQRGSMASLSAGLDSCFLPTPDTRSIDVKTLTPSALSSSTHFDSQDDWDSFSEATISSLKYSVDPIDHSRLTRAWREMLSSRWISASVTSVLPFYLSAIFQNFRALPALEIVIGPTSTSHPFASEGFQQMIDPEPFRHLRYATVKDDPGSSVTWMPAGEAPPHLVPSQAPMHLARMVAIITSCKEAIWHAYNRLYCNDPGRMPSLNDRSGQIHTIREEFEYYWFNWECDMRSRTDMASNTQERLPWVVRQPEPNPDNRSWLKSVKELQKERDIIGLASHRPVKPEVVRCVRGFVAWKFSGSFPERGPNVCRDRSSGLPGYHLAYS